MRPRCVLSVWVDHLDRPQGLASTQTTRRWRLHQCASARLRPWREIKRSSSASDYSVRQLDFVIKAPRQSPRLSPRQVPSAPVSYQITLCSLPRTSTPTPGVIPPYVSCAAPPNQMKVISSVAEIMQEEQSSLVVSPRTPPPNVTHIASAV